MTYYTSPTLPYQQTQWRVSVIPSTLFAGQRTTEYQWRNKGQAAWRPHHDWATWDGNEYDGGLPPVCLKLFTKYESEIKAVLAGLPVPLPAQPSLFASQQQGD